MCWAGNVHILNASLLNTRPPYSLPILLPTPRYILITPGLRAASDWRDDNRAAPSVPPKALALALAVCKIWTILAALYLKHPVKTRRDEAAESAASSSAATDKTWLNPGVKSAVETFRKVMQIRERFAALSLGLPPGVDGGTDTDTPATAATAATAASIAGDGGDPLYDAAPATAPTPTRTRSVRMFTCEPPSDRADGRGLQEEKNSDTVPRHLAHIAARHCSRTHDAETEGRVRQLQRHYLTMRRRGAEGTRGGREGGRGGGVQKKGDNKGQVGDASTPMLGSMKEDELSMLLRLATTSIISGDEDGQSTEADGGNGGGDNDDEELSGGRREEGKRTTREAVPGWSTVSGDRRYLDALDSLADMFHEEASGEPDGVAKLCDGDDGDQHRGTRNRDGGGRDGGGRDGGGGGKTSGYVQSWGAYHGGGYCFELGWWALLCSDEYVSQLTERGEEDDAGVDDGKDDSATTKSNVRTTPPTTAARNSAKAAARAAAAWRRKHKGMLRLGDVCVQLKLPLIGYEMLEEARRHLSGDRGDGGIGSTSGGKDEDICELEVLVLMQQTVLEILRRSSPGSRSMRDKWKNRAGGLADKANATLAALRKASAEEDGGEEYDEEVRRRLGVHRKTSGSGVGGRWRKLEKASVGTDREGTPRDFNMVVENQDMMNECWTRMLRRTFGYCVD